MSAGHSAAPGCGSQAAGSSVTFPFLFSLTYPPGPVLPPPRRGGWRLREVVQRVSPRGLISLLSPWPSRIIPLRAGVRSEGSVVALGSRGGG